MAALTYAQAGVDREAADKLVDRITALARATRSAKVKSSVGGYASLFEIDKKRLIAASTDGVGTKLKLAFELGEHRTVGIDLVAMSVNDLLCVGAEPLFFLDYFATGKLQAGVAEDVIAGVAEGCRQARCALVGGETAEMPDFYGAGEYDLAGFAVGMVESARVLPRKEIKPGDALIGVASSGCHSNGYSLLRRLLDQAHPQGSPDREKVARQLLTPTRIYTKAIAPLVKARLIKGMAHITGSGFLNVPRISEKVSYEIALPKAAELPEIYQWVRKVSGLPTEELAQTFNLGVGLVLAVKALDAKKVLSALKRSGERAWPIGEVIRKSPRQGAQVHLTDIDGTRISLSY